MASKSDDVCSFPRVHREHVQLHRLRGTRVTSIPDQMAWYKSVGGHDLLLQFVHSKECLRKQFSRYTTLLFRFGLISIIFRWYVLDATCVRAGLDR